MTTISERVYKQTIMAAGLEGTRDYLVSIAERTFGVNAYKRWQVWAEQQFEPTSDAYKNRKETGVFTGFIQFTLPSFTEAVARSWSKSQFGTGEEANENIFIGWAKYSAISMVDYGSGILLYNTVDNIPQFVAYKLALNAVTHIGLDLAGRAVDKLRGFRPPTAATLAV